ncbi:RNA polymerase sigma factor [Catalinimonas niigatensis]|uniref:RNA polymerase sigma factor n=1 Tax=Catalinimonas niigatensis TaxID=1397264 RepID=UPI002664F84E|nr:sigma-70 family RNA polymerase sigma factor [Catalinimonas niigatensis]WPP48163.1 sigma-70 family RNA polymerase sigma factor [Catalinimonas niigatensis]
MEAISITSLADRRNLEIERTVLKERGRLLNFIRQRVPDRDDAEDILQDVFFQFTQAYRTIESIERVTGWLFRVTRNKIADLYRKKKPEPFSQIRPRDAEDEEALGLEELLPDMNIDPEDTMMRNVIWEALEAALGEMPTAQRDVFVMHEFEDISFREMSEMTGESINTLLSRKRYAIQFLRKKLQDIYNDL